MRHTKKDIDIVTLYNKKAATGGCQMKTNCTYHLKVAEDTYLYKFTTWLESMSHFLKTVAIDKVRNQNILYYCTVNIIS